MYYKKHYVRMMGMNRLLMISMILLLMFIAITALTTHTQGNTLSEEDSASATEYINLKDPVGEEYGDGSISYTSSGIRRGPF